MPTNHRSLVAALALVIGVMPSLIMGQIHRQHHPACCGSARGDSPVVPVSCFASYADAPGPYVPWFTLPQQPNGALARDPAVVPGGPCPAGPLDPYSPYATNGFPLPVTASANNPQGAGGPAHVNITRYWSTPPNYVVVLPPGATPNSLVLTGTFNSNLAPGVFNGLPAGNPAAAYTWQQWITFVNQTFGRFTNLPFSNAQAAPANPVWINGPYDSNNVNILATPPGSPFNVFTGRYIWGCDVGGPTGNGINEVILTDQASAAGAPFGLVSAIVNPATGQFDEADIIISLSALFQTLGPSGLTTLPQEWSTLGHEVAHFFGLDHTNLSAGAVLANVNPAQGGSSLRTIPTGFTSTFPASLAHFPPRVTPALPEVPTSVFFPYYAGTGSNLSAAPLHPDDGAALAALYPVNLAQNGQVPLINVSARIIGRHTQFGQGSNGLFNRNVWTTLAGTAGNAPTVPGFGVGHPINGTISGICRLSQTEGSILSDNTIYARPAGHVLPQFNNTGIYQGTGTGHFFNTPAGAPAIPSVLGETLAGNACTGDFSIEGIVPGVPGAPLAYDVVIEDPAALLGGEATNLAQYQMTSGAGAIFSLTGNQAEWWGDAVWAGNSPFGGPPVAQIPTPTVVRNVFGPLGLSSGLRVVAGTVIALDPMEHSESQRPNATLPGTVFSTSPQGVNYGVLWDQYIRPLVDIQPRTGRNLAVPVTIQAYPTRDLGNIIGNGSGAPATTIALGTARLFVNGNDVTATVLANFPPTVNPTTQVATWQIPMTAIFSAAQTLGPITVTFAVSETAIAPFQTIMAPYTTYGRNDVVL